MRDERQLDRDHGGQQDAARPAVLGTEIGDGKPPDGGERRDKACHGMISCGTATACGMASQAWALRLMAGMPAGSIWLRAIHAQNRPDRGAVGRPTRLVKHRQAGKNYRSDAGGIRCCRRRFSECTSGQRSDAQPRNDPGRGLTHEQENPTRRPRPAASSCWRPARPPPQPWPRRPSSRPAGPDQHALAEHVAVEGHLPRIRATTSPRRSTT